MADVGSLSRVSVDRAAQYQVRPRNVETPRATAVERPEGPSEGVTLSERATEELAGTRRDERPAPAPADERPDNRAAGSAEQLRLELAKPRDEQDADRIQQLIAGIQGELNGAGDGANPDAARFRSATKVPLEGYDARNLADPKMQTPKYLFGRVAQNFDLSSVKGDKSKAETLLKAMVPELKAAGLEVVGVEGDRIQVKTEVGYEWVDVIRGAGGDDPGWWWGSEAKGTEKPTASANEWAAMTGQGTPGGGGAAAAGGGAPAAPHGPAILGSQIDSGKVMGILQKHPPTNDGIRAALPELQQAFPGVTILDHPKRLDKLQFANGAVVDVIVGSGGPQPSWGWMPEN